MSMDDFDENSSKKQDSVYSFNYTDPENNRTVRGGDYHADEDTHQSSGYSYYTDNTDYAGGYDQGSQGRYSGADDRTDYGTSRGRKKREKREKRERGQTPFGIKVVRAAVLAVVFGAAAGGTFYGITAATGVQSIETAEVSSVETEEIDTSVSTTTETTTVVVSDVTEIVEEVMPAIVAITTMSQTEYYNMFGQSTVYDSESCGSGIIVSDDDTYIYIVTNNHVISGATSLTVCFEDESTVSAEIKGADSGSDLAVVSVKKDDMSSDTLDAIKIAVLGDSDSLKVGEPAVAIGNALGYGQSVTTGVISALNREVTVTDSDTQTSVTSELIQTDAAINPGNSGGALLNINGEVVGINSVKYSDTDVEGMGYAIPISTAKPIIEDLIEREEVEESQKASLGIVGVDVTEEVASSYNMPEGVYIVSVTEGGAAETAGLQKGDIITSFDGHEVTSMDSLEEQLDYYAAGTTVDVVIERSDNGSYEEMTLSVTLGSKY